MSIEEENNKIATLVVEGSSEEGIQEVRDKVQSYFQIAFLEEDLNRPTLDDVDFDKILELDNEKLCCIQYEGSKRGGMKLWFLPYILKEHTKWEKRFLNYNKN